MQGPTFESEEMLELNLKTMLPTIREAFDNKTLQMFTADEDAECLYAGPCAIGVCIPEDKRSYFDDYSGCGATGIGTLIDDSLIGVSEEERTAIEDLQSFHDAAVRWCFIKESDNYKDAVARFERELSRLEETYL